MRTAVAIALVASLLLAGSVKAPLGPSMEAPAWSIGDFWEYSFNTTFEGFVALTGRVRADILDVRSATVGGVALDVFVVDTVGTGLLDGQFPTDLGTIPAEGTWNLTGEQFITVPSRKVVKSLLDIRASGLATVPLLGSQPFTFQWANSTTNRVEADEWTYPVPIGTTGVVTLNGSWRTTVNFALGSIGTTPLEDSGVATYSLTVELVGTDVVTVPVGASEVYVILEAWPDGSREEFDFAPAAGNNARTIAYNASGGEVSRTELVAFRYQDREPLSGLLLPLGLVAVAVALAIVLGILVHRRRARETRYTPPSLQEPPTEGPGDRAGPR